MTDNDVRVQINNCVSDGPKTVWEILTFCQQSLGEINQSQVNFVLGAMVVERNIKISDGKYYL